MRMAWRLSAERVAWKTRRNIAIKSPYMEQSADFLLPEAESSNTAVHISRQWTTTNAAVICRDTNLGRSNDFRFPSFQFGGGGNSLRRLSFFLDTLFSIVLVRTLVTEWSVVGR